jgi:hypothetical protein
MMQHCLIADNGCVAQLLYNTGPVPTLVRVLDAISPASPIVRLTIAMAIDTVGVLSYFAPVCFVGRSVFSSDC